MTDTPIRVVLVDDHAVIRAGLEQLLGGTDDIVVVGTAANGAQALEVVREIRPNVVLMDLQMPEVDGVAATRAIMAADLGVDVLVLTSFSDSERIIAALDAGAVGYLLKDADPEDVLQGIRAVSRGESPIHPKAARALLGVRAGSSQVQLTSRETEVLTLVREGLANKQIAQRLWVTPKTIKFHLSNVFRKLDVANRTEATHQAQLLGLLQAGGRGAAD